MSHPEPDPDPLPPTAPPAAPVRATEAEHAQLRVDIAHLRVDLGDTIAELTERVDVPARVKAQTRQTTNQARRLVTEKAAAVQEAAKQRPVPVAAIAGGALFVLTAFLLRRRRPGPA